MTLDILIPTWNREAFLRRTLESIAAAPEPPGLSVVVTVIDNNSTDGTATTVKRAMGLLGDRLRYVFEARQGRAHALNAGIAATDGELVGIIDDDEEIHPDWLSVVCKSFQDPALDFIGGPYIPKWACAPPDWLPPSYGGVIGWAETVDHVQEFGPAFPGHLCGGNGVIRRGLLERCGPYSTELGPIAGRPLVYDDVDMYERLLAAGGRGLYLPHLIIFHHIFPERLTKRYFRRWAFWGAVSRGLYGKRQPSPVPHLLGVPRWYFRTGGIGAWKAIHGWFRHSPASAFGGELDLIQLVGSLYGRHIFRPASE